ncbi:hypothetical protein [Streptomyces sp. MS2.AVA.5]|uniref:Uncharacterized protein n=1 Tax=Streptomyces achmelvichensis TaxID=3134111 RepID=A0ACC6Q920_9ACTN
MKTIRDATTKAAVTATVLAHAVRERLDAIRQEADQGSDRGDGPISTVIIIMASIAGALVIAGALAVLYGKYATKLTGE